MGNELHPINPDELISLEDMSRIAGLDSSALRKRIRAGRLQYRKIGRAYATTLRWLAESETPARTGRPPKRLSEGLRPPEV